MHSDKDDIFSLHKLIKNFAKSTHLNSLTKLFFVQTTPFLYEPKKVNGFLINQSSLLF